jgi:hypothetical protein
VYSTINIIWVTKSARDERYVWQEWLKRDMDMGLAEKFEGRSYLQDLAVDGRIRFILKKEGGRT